MAVAVGIGLWLALGLGGPVAAASGGAQQTYESLFEASSEPAFRNFLVLLANPGTISFQIVDRDGKPVPSIKVTRVSMTAGDWHHESPSGLGSVGVPDGGIYEIRVTAPPLDTATGIRLTVTTRAGAPPPASEARRLPKVASPTVAVASAPVVPEATAVPVLPVVSPPVRPALRAELIPDGIGYLDPFQPIRVRFLPRPPAGHRAEDLVTVALAGVDGAWIPAAGRRVMTTDGDVQVIPDGWPAGAVVLISAHSLDRQVVGTWRVRLLPDVAVTARRQPSGRIEISGQWPVATDLAPNPAGQVLALDGTVEVDDGAAPRVFQLRNDLPPSFSGQGALYRASPGRFTVSLPVADGVAAMVRLRVPMLGRTEPVLIAEMSVGADGAIAPGEARQAVPIPVRDGAVKPPQVGGADAGDNGIARVEPARSMSAGELGETPGVASRSMADEGVPEKPPVQIPAMATSARDLRTAAEAGAVAFVAAGGPPDDGVMAASVSVPVAVGPGPDPHVVATPGVYDRLPEFRPPGAPPPNPGARVPFVHRRSFALRGEGIDPAVSWPRSVTFDHRGVLWVVDNQNRRIAAHTIEGDPVGGFGRRGNAAGELGLPTGIAIEGRRIFVADTANHCVHVFDPIGRSLGQIGRWGVQRGELDLPHGIEVASGVLWIADRGNCRINRFSFDGVCLGVFGIRGEASGQLSQPVALRQHGGRIWVLDQGLRRVTAFDVEGRARAEIAIDSLVEGTDLLVDFWGRLLIADGDGQRVVCLDPATKVLLGNLPPPVTPRPWLPTGLALRADGVLAVADGANRMIHLFDLGQ